MRDNLKISLSPGSTINLNSEVRKISKMQNSLKQLSHISSDPHLPSYPHQIGKGLGKSNFHSPRNIGTFRKQTNHLSDNLTKKLLEDKKQIAKYVVQLEEVILFLISEFNRGQKTYFKLRSRFEKLRSMYLVQNSEVLLSESHRAQRFLVVEDKIPDLYPIISESPTFKDLQYKEKYSRLKSKLSFQKVSLMNAQLKQGLAAWEHPRANVNQKQNFQAQEVYDHLFQQFQKVKIQNHALKTKLSNQSTAINKILKKGLLHRISKEVQSEDEKKDEEGSSMVKSQIFESKEFRRLKRTFQNNKNEESIEVDI